MPLADTRTYEFALDLRLRIFGSRSVTSYFDAEYADARVESGSPAVEVGVGVPLTDGGAGIRGSHKTVAWEVSLGDPRTAPLRARIRLRGRPRSFALSLVQGYIVEPLLALAAAHAGTVLLPAAGLVRDGGALLVLGRSRSGKSSVSARALARGTRVLGDDQVLIEGEGRCLPFPRRLRAYGDLPATAPAAYARLARSLRARMALRRALQIVTRGYVAPPLHIPPAAFGQQARPRAATVARVALVERAAGLEQISAVAADVDEVVAFARALLEQQRAHLHVADEAWLEAAAAAAAAQEHVLRSALADAPAVRISVPATWPAQRAVPALARALGLEC